MCARGRRLSVVLLVLTLAATASAQTVESRARDAYRRAQALERSGDASGALALLWTASGLAPRDADIHMALASALERVGALDAAVEAWRAAGQARPHDARARRGLVLALVAVGRGPEAVTLARAATQEAPADPERLFTLALAQSEQDVDAALATLREVLSRSPGHALARYNLALLLKRLDRFDEAIAELTGLLATAPRPEVHHALGMARWHRGESREAAEAFQAAIDLDARHAEAWHMLGVVRAARRDWRAAEDALRHALALRPSLPGVHATLARVLSASGDESRARQHMAEGERLRRAAEREREARVWTSLGTARLEQGEALSALDAFRRAIGGLETYAPAHFQMGRALERLGDPAAAAAAYARAHALNAQLVPPRPATASAPAARP